MNKLLHRLLYRLLPLDKYLRTMSRLFFRCYAWGLGRRSRAMEYVYHLPALVKEGDTAIDIGANLGYYTIPLSRLVGPKGSVFAIEPVPAIYAIMEESILECGNVHPFNYALGEDNREVEIANDSIASDGYFGTGRNFVDDSRRAAKGAMRFRARMRRGSELFAPLKRIDFIKCDIEGYEPIVLREMMPLIERHRPTLLVESTGENRREVIEMLTQKGYETFTLGKDGGEYPLESTGDMQRDIIFRHKDRYSR